jgi:hypothetical protein
MGPLKEALFKAVHDRLLGFPKNETLINQLNHPQNGCPNVRAAWTNLKTNGKAEGMKTTTGLQAVLAENGGMFAFYVNEKGHNLIQLAEARQSAELSDLEKKLENDIKATEARLVQMEAEAAAASAALSGEPAASANPAVAASTAKAASPAGTGATAKASSGALPSPQPVGLAGPLPVGLKSGAAVAPTLPVPPVIATAATAAAAAPKAKSKTKFISEHYFGGDWKSGRGYTDIVWTPEKQAHKDTQSAKVNGFIRAIFNALDLQPGKQTSLSTLGGDFKVAELKKDPMFKNWKVRDALEEYTDVFVTEIAPGMSGGILVKLQPNAREQLPDALTFFEQDQSVFFSTNASR